MKLSSLKKIAIMSVTLAAATSLASTKCNHRFASANMDIRKNTNPVKVSPSNSSIETRNQSTVTRSGTR